MSIKITYDSQGNDITCMKEFDALKYPCKECDRTDCDNREEYKEGELCIFTKDIWVVFIYQMMF